MQQVTRQAHSKFWTSCYLATSATIWRESDYQIGLFFFFRWGRNWWSTWRSLKLGLDFGDWCHFWETYVWLQLRTLSLKNSWSFSPIKHVCSASLDLRPELPLPRGLDTWIHGYLHQSRWEAQQHPAEPWQKRDVRTEINVIPIGRSFLEGRTVH